MKYIIQVTWKDGVINYAHISGGTKQHAREATEWDLMDGQARAVGWDALLSVESAVLIQSFCAVSTHVNELVVL